MRKKITIILMLALFILVSAPVSARTFVLSIGIADYDGDEHDLQRSGQDAIKFSDVMKTQTKDVVTLTSRNATRENVIVALAAVCSKAKEGDRIVFFYSGHGADGCIVATDLKPVNYSEMMQLFSASKAKEIVCFFDSAGCAFVRQGYRVFPVEPSRRDVAGRLWMDWRGLSDTGFAERHPWNGRHRP